VPQLDAQTLAARSPNFGFLAAYDERLVHHWDVEDARNYERYRMNEGDIVLAMDRPVCSSGIKRTLATLRLDAIDASTLTRIRRGLPGT
jgi:hypothetical protein